MSCYLAESLNGEYYRAIDKYDDGRHAARNVNIKNSALHRHPVVYIPISA